MADVTSNLKIALIDDLTTPAEKMATALGRMQMAEKSLTEQSAKLNSAAVALAKFTGLETRMSSTAAQINKQRAALKELGQTILTTTGSTKKLEQQFKAGETQVGRLTASLEKQRKTASETAASFEKLSGSALTSSMRAQSELKARIESTTTALREQARATAHAAEIEKRTAERRKRWAETPAIIGQLAGPSILHATGEAILSGAEVQHERVNLRSAGMGAMLPSIEKQSLALAARYKNVSQTQIMEMAKEARSVLTKPSEIAEVLPTLAAARSALAVKDPTGESGANLGMLVKGAESIGAAKDPERLAKLIDSYVRAIQVMGKTINPEAIYEFDKYSKSAGARMSDRFLMTTGLSLAQEMGGSTAANDIFQTQKDIVGGFQNKHIPLGMMADIGLINKNDIVRTKTGEAKGLKRGAHVKGDNLAASDLDLWVYDVLLPAMEKNGITKEDDQLNFVQRGFKGTEADVITKLITQRQSFEAHGRNFFTASGTKGADGISEDPLAAMKGLTTSLQTFAGVLTSPIMKDAAGILDGLATALGHASVALGDWSKDHPTGAKVAAGGAIAGGAYVGGRLTFDLFKNVFGDKGMKGAAVAQIEAGAGLKVAAAELSAAAIKLGGGSVAGIPGGPGVPGGEPGKAGAPGWNRALPLFLGLPGLAFSAPGMGPEGDKTRAANYGAIEWLGNQATKYLGLDALKGLLNGAPKVGPPVSANNGLLTGRLAVPGDQGLHFDEGGGASQERSWWQRIFGSASDESIRLKSSFADLAGSAQAAAMSLASMGGLGGGSGGLINASFETGDGGSPNLSGGGFNVGGGKGAGHFFSAEQRAANIRSAALANGIDPRYAMAVARSEGFGKFSGDHNRSFGDFQMFTGGGLGNRYRRETGKDPSDPHNELDLDRYAMREAAKGGWGPWHGARRLGITGHMGMGRPRRVAPEGHPAAKAIQALNGASATPLVDTRHLERTAALIDHINDGIHRMNSGGVGARAGSYRTAMNGSFTTDHWRRGA